MIYRSSDIYRLLKTGISAAQQDCATFKKWWGKEISLFECMDEFRANNGITDDKEIPLDEFETWLRGLGWK